MNKPIVCSLSAPDAAERAAETSKIARRALTSREPMAAGELLRFSADSGTEEAVRSVIAAEAQCCAFLRMELRRTNRELQLEITGPPEAKSIIESLFA